MSFSQRLNNSDLNYFLWLSLFSVLLVSSYVAVMAEDKSATAMLLIIITFVAAIKLVRLHYVSRLRLKSVLKALANDDSTLGLPSKDPLIDEFNRVRKRLNQSRFEIEAQHQFLQTMLSHIDSGILVLNGDEQILHKNPALERLLGVLPSDISNELWGALGDFITSSKQSARCVIPWQRGAHKDTLSIRLTCSSIQSQPVKIISIQSIYQALQAKEQQAYKNLTKVLTHEIANSIMPLASLAETCGDLLPESLQFDNDEDKQDLVQALKVIARRASHLDLFIKRFSESSRLPQPDLSRIDVKNQIEQVLSLFENSLAESGVEVVVNSSQEKYWLMGDSGQLEQVFVNLLKNAMDSLLVVNLRKVTISIAYNKLSQLVIDFQDTGLGIELAAQDKIFIPFFTTKKQGSGIGLSLSRQIMSNHGGDLLYIDNADSVNVSTKQNSQSGACFRLVFG